MRILFISQTLGNFGFEPLGIMCLSAMAKKNSHETMICAGNRNEIKDAIESYKPDMLAFSICTGGHKELFEINRELKRPGMFSIFGGSHPTFFPEMIQEEGIDAICIGEGELAFEELLDKLSTGADITGIQNLHVKKDGEIFKNELRDLVDDLDTLPFPDREILYARKEYREHKNKTFLVHRGCPYNCSYCFNQAYFKMYHGKGKRLRTRSPQSTVAEVKRVKDNYPMEMAYFMDDIFILDKAWLKEFADLYKKEVGLPYWCHVRVNHVDQEIVDILKDSGCYFVSMGVESGNERIRREILNRKMSNEQIIEVGRLLRANGIKFITYTMLGLPTETLENAIESMEVNARCRPAHAWAALFHPYPKTELGELSIVSGLFDGNYDTFTFSVQKTTQMKLEHRREFINLQKLFAIGAEFPKTIPLIKLLIKLPLGPFYDFLRKVFKGYCGWFRFIPYKLTFSEVMKISFSFLISKGR